MPQSAGFRPDLRYPRINWRLWWRFSRRQPLADTEESLAQQDSAGNHCDYDSQKVLSRSNRHTNRAYRPNASRGGQTMNSYITALKDCPCSQETQSRNYACGYSRHVRARESCCRQNSECSASEAHQSMGTFSRRLTGGFSLKPDHESKRRGQQQSPDRLKLRDTDRCQCKTLASSRGFRAPR